MAAPGDFDNLADAADAADGIVARCAQEGGLVQVTLETLRDELGYKKLGRWVLEAIAEHLSGAGLGYFPLATLNPDNNTEPRKWQEVWVYARDGGSRARIIDAVLRPEESDVRGILDGLAAGYLESLTPEQKLNRIIEIATA
jgi:hypothetical protein